jgi:hypothetical protein
MLLGKLILFIEKATEWFCHPHKSGGKVKPVDMNAGWRVRTPSM